MGETVRLESDRGSASGERIPIALGAVTMIAIALLAAYVPAHPGGSRGSHGSICATSRLRIEPGGPLSAGLITKGARSSENSRPGVAPVNLPNCGVVTSDSVCPSFE